MYTLVGCDGNAFAIIGYTQRAMKECGFGSIDIKEMREKATSGDYYNVISTCDEYITLCNAKIGYTDEDE